MRAYALRRTDPASADDAVAEVFAIVWRRLDDVPSDNAAAWLLGVARRVLANARRADERRERLTERVTATTTPWIAGDNEGGVDDNGRVQSALASLRPIDREALCLIAWDGLTTEEAATVAGVSRGTFAVRLHRARARFRREYERATSSAGIETPSIKRVPND